MLCCGNDYCFEKELDDLRLQHNISLFFQVLHSSVLGHALEAKKYVRVSQCQKEQVLE